MLTCRVCVQFVLVLIAAASIAADRSDGTPRGGKTAAPPFMPDRLAAMLRHKQEERRLAGLAEAAQFHRQQPALAQVLKNAIDATLNSKSLTRSTVEAVRLYCQLEDPGLLESQLDLAEAEDDTVATVAAVELGKRQVPEALTPLLRLEQRPAYAKSFGMRRAVIDAVANYPDVQAVDFLVQSVAQWDGQLRFESARHLARLTGQNFGGHSDGWQEWFGRSARMFKSSAEPAAPAISDEMPWPTAVPRFFGTPIYGQRVLFVIDRSRSMLSSAEGITRMEVVQSELDRTISALPESTFFSLLAYEEQVRPWASELVAATPESKSDAIRFVWSLAPQRKTALYDALTDGLARDSNLEVLILLSDGKPTAGQVVIPSLIVDSITAQNAFRQVSINAIGVDVRGEEQQFLDALTRRNFGSLRFLR